MTLLALCCSAKINVASPLTINLKPWQTIPRGKKLTTTKRRNQRGGKKGISRFTFMGNFSEIFQKEKRVDLAKNKNQIQIFQNQAYKKLPSQYIPNKELKQFILDIVSKEKKSFKVFYIFMAI